MGAVARQASPGTGRRQRDHAPLPISNSLLRAATEDVELARVVFPAGIMVFANTAAAKRGPAIYDDPDRFDITREGLPPILTFGAGVHFCLGANLARMEIAEAPTAVTRRIPTPAATGQRRGSHLLD